LHFAAGKNKVPVVELLIDVKANVDASDNVSDRLSGRCPSQCAGTGQEGVTPLLTAVDNVSAPAAAALIHNKADLTVSDKTVRGGHGSGDGVRAR
jgi:hypothetical protein